MRAAAGQDPAIIFKKRGEDAVWWLIAATVS
jgi:hypothetical protein